MVIARWAWRDRSELAPFGVAALVAGFGAYAHPRCPRWWPLILAAAGISAWALGAFGGRFGVPGRLERVYRPDGARLRNLGRLAAAIGPFVSPLPQALGIGVCSVGSVVANRRRRAKVRVERTIRHGPTSPGHPGLAGSQILSVTVDLWGWRARLRLARGQTIADVMAKIPAIYSGFGCTATPSASTRSRSPRQPLRAGAWTAIRTLTRSLARPFGHFDRGADRPRTVRGR